LQHLAVSRQGRFIPFSLTRLNAAPFEGKAQGVLAEGGGAVEVLFGAMPPVGSGARSGSVADLVRELLPGPPVVVSVVAFDLVGGGSGAPEEVLREAENRTVVGQDIASSRYGLAYRCVLCGGQIRLAACRRTL